MEAFVIRNFEQEAYSALADERIGRELKSRAIIRAARENAYDTAWAALRRAGVPSDQCAALLALAAKGGPR